MASRADRRTESIDTTPVKETAKQSECCCKTLSLVTKVAISFFILSAVGFGVLYNYNLSQYFPITYGVGGFSAAVLIVQCIRSCCCKKTPEQIAKDENDEMLRKLEAAKPDIMGIKPKTKEGKKAEPLLQAWMNERAPYARNQVIMPRMVQDNECILLLKYDGSFGNPIFDAGRKKLFKHPLYRFICPDISKYWWPGIAPTDCRHINDEHEGRVCTAKNRLFSVAFNQDGTMTQEGRNLLATGNTPIYIEAEVHKATTLEDGACDITYDQSNPSDLVLRVKVGWLAVLLTELREKLKTLQ